MHLILTGATGLVGSACLNSMLANSAITKVSILSRRPVPMAANNPKATVIIHKDYTLYPPDLLAQLKDATACVWAQGISVNAVSKAEYVKITLDYPLAAATAFASLAPRFTFVYVSGEGATTTPSILTPFFGRIKGQAESTLLALSKSNPSLKIYSVRPAYVDPGNHPEIHDYIPKRNGLLMKVVDTLAPVLRATSKNNVTPTKDLGDFLTGLAEGEGEVLEGAGIEGEGRTVRNVAIRRLRGI